jgi:Ran GTPase-activating protein (RanGAP) involved in mRNA processing and transport
MSYVSHRNRWMRPEELLEQLRGTPLESIETLDLGYNQLGPEGAALLARFELPALRSLSLEANRIGERGALALAGARWIDQLTTLRLGGARRYGRDNHIGDGGLSALGGRLARVEELELCLNELRGTALDALRACPLRWLDLSANRIGDGGLAGVLGVPRPTLTVLRLRGCGLGPEGARRIASSDAPLEMLELGADGEGSPGNPIGDEGARWLAEAPALAGLRHLGLRECGIGDAGVEAIAGSPWLEQLETLLLGDNQITEAGLEALVRSPRLPRLTRLGLTNTPAGPKEEVWTDWDGGVVGGSMDEAMAASIAARFGRPMRVC